MSLSWPDLPGVEVLPLGDGVLRIVIDPAPAPAHGAEVEAAWERMRGANPRLYDGGILAVADIAPANARIAARRDRYARLAVQPGVRTGVQQLSVTGVLTSPGHVLLARRGAGTRIYAGMWELCPSGGIDPPADGTRVLGPADVHRQLALEAAEELGAALPMGRASAIARDRRACSDDIVVRVDVSASAVDPRPARGAWEYDEVRWVPLADLPLFDAAHAAEIIPPTRALMRHLGWVTP